MNKIPHLAVLVLAALAFAGCATTPSAPAPRPSPAPMAAPAPESPAVTPPAAVTAPQPPEVATPPPAAVVVDAAPATIIGSEETSTMLDNFTVFVAEIDGIPVAAGRAGWNVALPLKPGPHRLTLGFKRGVFSSQAIVELKVESRAAYQVRFASDAELFGKNSYCEFWIVNVATDEPVITRVRSGLTRVEPAK